MSSDSLSKGMGLFVRLVNKGRYFVAIAEIFSLLILVKNFLAFLNWERLASPLKYFLAANSYAV